MSRDVISHVLPFVADVGRLDGSIASHRSLANDSRAIFGLSAPAATDYRFDGFIPYIDACQLGGLCMLAHGSATMTQPDSLQGICCGRDDQSGHCDMVG
jgi:hypothetical protein